MKTQIREFLQEEDGVTALEYGILAAIVAAAIALIFGTRLQAFFTAVFGELDTAAGVDSSGS